MSTSHHQTRIMWTHGNLSPYFLAIRSGFRNHGVNGRSLLLCWLNSSIRILHAIPQLVVLVAAVAEGRNAEGELRTGSLGLPSHREETNKMANGTLKYVAVGFNITKTRGQNN